jgi:hypothetical protein
MVPGVTPRPCLALLAAVVLVAVPSLLSIDGFVANDTPSAASALVGVTDLPDELVATPAKPHPGHMGIRTLPLAVVGAVAATFVIGLGRRRPAHGFQLHFGDVGDGWRALLIGAPPILR